MSGSIRIRRALLSVTDKSGLAAFAATLVSYGVELVSTGGTAKALREAGLTVRDISDLTGFPEMLDGRVKTLHPKVHGGLLHIRGNAEHMAAVAEHAIEPIDMAVVNLYAFEATAAKPGVSLDHIIENIDIGGPSMVRSAAKNYDGVAVVTRVADYDTLTQELKANGGALSRETRWKLATQAFADTAAYDSAIARTLATLELTEPGIPATPITPAPLPPALHIALPLALPLRYGENPHQQAALYADGKGLGIAGAKQLHGKELSYNNLVDLDAAWQLTEEFAEQTAVAIIKHTNPCGAAIGSSVLEAYTRALASDPVSAFGGIISTNREIDEAAAEEMAKLFVEAIAAPGFTPGALEKLKAKKNVRLLEVRPTREPSVLKQISGGLLLQTADLGSVTADDLKLVTKRAPSAQEISDLLFAWRVMKHVKSNAIVYAKSSQTIGIGAGQMSRVDAARFGAMKAVLSLADSVAASDAFFPFPDGLETVAHAGARAVIQPGGSVRDQEVIDAADRLDMAMVFTGIRHFRH